MKSLELVISRDDDGYPNDCVVRDDDGQLYRCKGSEEAAPISEDELRTLSADAKSTDVAREYPGDGDTGTVKTDW